MIRIPLLEGWTVDRHRGAFESLSGGRGEEKTTVTLPHDALHAAERRSDAPEQAATGYVPGNAFVYERALFAPDGWRDKVVLLNFEGVYRHARVFVNGKLAGQCSNGYTEFTVDLVPHLRFGKDNTITVEAKTHRDSRWYTGAGIYRPVHLIVADPVHIALDGVTVATPEIEPGRALLAVATTLQNSSRHTATVRTHVKILDGQGALIAEHSAPVTLLPGELVVARSRLSIAHPYLWSADAPALYLAEVRLVPEEESTAAPIDTATVSFGVRKLQVDPEHGLRVNGTAVVLRGACVHHDNGVLGAATFARAEERRVQLLKVAGFNAIRSAHHPMSRAMLDACDRLGMYVMDELTDVWTRAKTAFDASHDFPSSWEEDVVSMVRKDINRPSVLMYSIGNEILEVATPTGATWGRLIAERIRTLDGSRFVTNAINGVIANLPEVLKTLASGQGSQDPNAIMAAMGKALPQLNASELITRTTEESASILDIVGINYGETRYRQDATAFPHRVIVGTESFPGNIATLWELVTVLPSVIGDFTWTGWDYLGEAGIGRVDYPDDDDYVAGGATAPFPALLAHTGDLDITGHRRTISRYRETVFFPDSAPAIAVHRPQRHGHRTLSTPWAWTDTVESWSWDIPAGTPVTVDVYSTRSHHLFLNGAHLTPTQGADVPPFVTRYETRYQPGELTATTDAENGDQRSATLRSAKGPIEVKVQVDRDRLKATGQDLAYLSVTLEDASGTVVVDRDRLIRVAVTGPGVLQGLGSARPDGGSGFTGSSTPTWDGHALAVVRAIDAGIITVRVEAAGLPHATCHLRVS